jgi:hypothetical protein
MSDGERIQRLIYDWLDRNYPEGVGVYAHAQGTILPALEIRMIWAFDAIEYNLGNGGWAQFLWNCFDDWRAIIDVARDGYLLIGAPEQSAALTKLWALCKRDERECREAMEQPTWLFAEFTARSYSASPNGWEDLFIDRGVYEKRLVWLAANEARVRKAIGMLD